LIGVRIISDGSSTRPNIDLGGGTLLNHGGNDFRSFKTQATISSGAIALGNTTMPIDVSVEALNDIFQAGINPNTVIDTSIQGSLTGAGNIDLSEELDAAHAFVQTLYNQLLGRTGTLDELTPWVQVLSTQGQAAVAAGIGKSSEALGRIVDSLYLRFLGRQSDPTGRSGWISFLQNGGTLESLETNFLIAPKYLNHINTDYVQSLYINILGRTGSGPELALWNNNIQNLGLMGIANSFTHAFENRLNTLRSYFQMFLHRTPSDTELIPAVNSSADLLSLAASVLSSPEFFMNG
jgi:hypothetical protein